METITNISPYLDICIRDKKRKIQFIEPEKHYDCIVLEISFKEMESIIKIYNKLK